MKTIIIYTHTDYQDVWDPLLRSIDRYLNGYDVKFLIDKESEKIPFDQITYNDEKSYTERLKESISKLTISNFIFMHEDMFLYDYPNDEMIERYFKYIERGVIKSIKLIPVGVQRIPCNFDRTLFLSEFSKFSIQPTIISKEHILEILSEVDNLSIWEFEQSIKFNQRHYISSIGNERKLGIYHFESLVFPYVSTAIVKGKWNFSEYPILENILNECGIDKNKRGTV